VLGLLTEVRNALRDVARARKESRKHEPRPPVEGLVLEVGSGQAAHPRADVLVDKYIADNFERPHEIGIDFAKPFVVADGQQLPFEDGSFAYTIALHVLEHATDPTRFAGELSRVGDAGFVQVPSNVSELTFGWPYHPWLIEREGDTLVFEARNGRRAPYGEIFHRGYAESPLLRTWWAANRSTFHHSVEWSGELSVRVTGSSVAEGTAEVDLEQTTTILEQLDHRGALKPHPPEVRAALRCPSCGGTVTWEQGTVTCASCGRAYPAVGEVPILLTEAAM
jgi:uncharacterized protein YbaR (Trm112 family)